MNLSFSVLMSVYKKEKPAYVDRSLESIYNQTVKPHEIVLVKDGPLTEHLEAVLREWERKFGAIFKTVSIKKNVGMDKAFNIGLKHCRFDWIARMDADDICHPNRFEIQINYLQDNPASEVLGSWIDEYDGTMCNFRGTRKVPTTHSQILQYAKSRCPMNHMTVFYKKEVVGEGYPVEMPGLGDYGLWSKLLAKGVTFANIPQSLVKVRTGDNFLQRRGGMKYLKNEMKLLKFQRELGFISPYYYISSLAIRAIVRLSPLFIRKYLYSVLRSL